VIHPLNFQHWRYLHVLPHQEHCEFLDAHMPPLSRVRFRMQGDWVMAGRGGGTEVHSGSHRARFVPQAPGTEHQVLSPQSTKLEIEGLPRCARCARCARCSEPTSPVARGPQPTAHSATRGALGRRAQLATRGALGVWERRAARPSRSWLLSEKCRLGQEKRCVYQKNPG
jgi:hypothetical protein